MAIITAETLAAYCDRLLCVADTPDYEGAVNGLQVERRGAVRRIAAAVDASEASIHAAGEWGADLLLAHHGLFWARRQPWTGRHYRIMRRLLDSNLAVYAAHLPLDVHPQLGNNARLCAAIGLRRTQPFFLQRGMHLGLRAMGDMTLSALSRKVADAVHGPVHVIPAGPGRARHIGVVTGGAGAELARAAEEGVDTFITGEGPHWTHALAEELGINVLYAGHYATETFGVKALVEHLARRFKLSWTFLGHPTGL